MHRVAAVFFAVLLSFVLILVQPLAAQALTMLDSGPIEELDSGISEAEADPIASFDELKDWLRANSRGGGSAILTKDIVVDENVRYQYPGSFQNNRIDTAEHTIYVRGELTLTPGLEIFGEGGENGILRVEPGAFLWLTSVGDFRPTIRAQEGYALYQVDGAVLLCKPENVEEGAIRFATKPVAWPLYAQEKGEDQINGAVVSVFSAAEKFDASRLPKTSKAYVIENGVQSSQPEELAVVWNVEEYREALDKKQRVTLTGSYGETYDMVDPPACLTVFLGKDSSALLYGVGRFDNEDRCFSITRLHFLMDDPTMPYCLLWSADAIDWYGTTPDQISPLSVNRWSALEGEILWHTEERLRYLALAVTDHTGKIRYSEIFEVDQAGFFSAANVDGGRNGETLPGNPPIFPDGSGNLPPVPDEDGSMLPPLGSGNITDQPGGSGGSIGSGGGSDGGVDRETAASSEASVAPPAGKGLSTDPASKLTVKSDGDKPIIPQQSSPAKVEESSSALQNEPLISSNPPAQTAFEQSAEPVLQPVPPKPDAVEQQKATRWRQIVAGFIVFFLIGAPVYMGPIKKMRNQKEQPK